MVEAVISGITDEFPVLGQGHYRIKNIKLPRKIVFIGILCIIMFLLGLPMCMNVSIQMHMYGYSFIACLPIEVRCMRGNNIGRFYSFKKLETGTLGIT